MRRFNSLYYEMVQAKDFSRYKNLKLKQSPEDDKLYNSITLKGDLMDYNTKQLRALMTYAQSQLPDKTYEDVQEFINKALRNPETHKILRNHIAYHNPELFEYLND